MNIITIILASVLGATVTFYVSEQLKQGPVRASALLSLTIGLFFYCFPNVLNVYLTQNIPLVFIGASFIGMASPKGKNNYLLLAFAGLLFSIVYINKSAFFKGYGGALGTLAFIALITTLFFAHLLTHKSKMLSRFKWMKNKVFNNENN